MPQPTVKLVLASCSEDLTDSLIEEVAKIGDPNAQIVVVSEFQSEKTTEWIPYRLSWTTAQNERLIDSKLRGRPVSMIAILLQPNMPFWPMRWIGFKRKPWGLVVFNENLGHFSLTPSNLPTMVRHVLWRTGNWFRWQFGLGGKIRQWLWRLGHPIQGFRRPILYRLALRAGLSRDYPETPLPAHGPALEEGISVIIPTRNGRDLLAQCLPPLLAQAPSEVIIVDNGSDDGTADWLAANYPNSNLRTIVSKDPLSFAAAVNRGIAQARYSHLLLLNNDMIVEPGFLAALRRPFDLVPDLFSSTAQIFFPEGVRREETGKAMMAPRQHFSDFCLTCVPPFDGEDQTYVLYGSGGCSLYSTTKLRQLGALDEIYTPAYVEDLDLGFRAWRLGWPSVFAAAARVLHKHRATTSRYLTPELLQHALEINYLKWLMRAFSDRATFHRLWREAIYRINCYAVESKPYLRLLNDAREASSWTRPLPPAVIPEAEILALNSGKCAIFPGRPRDAKKPVVLIAACYLPYPLSHGGAVRMYNLMRRAAAHVDQVLVAFSTTLDSVPPELTAICTEVVIVEASGSHDRPLTHRPDIVEEFDRSEFRAALRQTIRKWSPSILQLEFTQTAVYANEASLSNAKTILVEHDITLDLYGQLLKHGHDWETEREYHKWQTFEREAWKQMDCIVTMSEKDKAIVEGARRVEALLNGVDLERFTPSATEPDPARLLFIGSFAHLPNVLALEWFLNEVWPHLKPLNPTLHIIAGRRPEYYLERYAGKATVDLTQPGIELESFVSDVRPAYHRASVVVAPLLASAGTNIKIMEAMAMGKAIVSTPGGINGLELEDGREVLVAKDGPMMAEFIIRLLKDPAARKQMETAARACAERDYNWDSIAEAQQRLYSTLTHSK